MRVVVLELRDAMERKYEKYSSIVFWLLLLGGTKSACPSKSQWVRVNEKNNDINVLSRNRRGYTFSMNVSLVA